MKKMLLAAAILAMTGSAFAHETAYTCSREAKNGFVTPDIEYVQFTNNGKPYIYLKEIDGSEAYYRYDSLEDLENGGVYSGDRKSVISISSDKRYPLIVHYQDETKSIEYHCTLNAEMNSVIAGKEKREAKEAAEIQAMQEKMNTRSKAEAAAALAAQRKAAAAAKAAKAALQAESKGTSYSGASMAQSTGYTQQVIHAIESDIPDLEQWKGASCDVQISIASDGTITGYLTGVGSSGLCSAVSGSLERMGKLPRPPSQGIYELMKNMNISLEIK
ncbi:TPA: cell envelope integrity protein TolA [Klebsiella pneumoniae]|uniref:cell envelope integrity protein TolA n=1 Tax=Klebsiella pneumoniae TaxID=573 RepID=UPI0003BEE0BC|nr:cell envelope integrity protein TolA [Klebsiella pneumoniae]EIX9112890.1 cell envelope integrity protein TolA [Klebsiella pneumoniae]EJD3763489.1 cell envelope integrity protein TolA [Klebsiella pneumoniae]ESM39891.1 protein TolA [Klebsiella pneumoniae BWH 30]MEA4196635.1 cell envelope integrity protein TolA [Klebsiella pneumoniae]PLP24116.1 cell envelope integrity protein TolA [Klebsiella pneumoniae]